ncbi:MAG: hypothetical protein B6I36_10115 [Desulfobacteraceae bacterium 4572_35.1]|nr:MAG: hypothetical protein B6I36_10115 [Desulfobacteraceae bacterium 4572_35.1]
MTTVEVITGYLDGIVLALTPVQRWNAARNGSSVNFMTQQWFIALAIASIIILMVSLIIISYNRTKRERKNTENLFDEYAEKARLTSGERQVVLSIADKAGLKRNDSIFTLVSAFDRGVVKLKESLEGRQTIAQSKQLDILLFSLREKLGFKKGPSFSKGLSHKSKSVNSRQIPVGRNVHITRRNIEDAEAIQAAVIKNSDTELAVQLPKLVKITFGEEWNVRYYFGASIWEFSTQVTSYDGNIMILEHSNSIRFINRRRFLRVPVKKPAYIAHFPFETKLSKIITDGTRTDTTTQNLVKTILTPPKFVPATVTELGVSGLCLKVSIEANVGDRVLIVFGLDTKKERRVIKSSGKSELATALNTIETIAKVKRTENMPDGLLIAVELKDLSDSDINKLICITNAASLGVTDENIPVSENGEKRILQHAGV